MTKRIRKAVHRFQVEGKINHSSSSYKCGRCPLKFCNRIRRWWHMKKCPPTTDLGKDCLKRNSDSRSRLIGKKTQAKCKASSSRSRSQSTLPQLKKVRPTSDQHRLPILKGYSSEAVRKIIVSSPTVLLKRPDPEYLRRVLHYTNLRISRRIINIKMNYVKRKRLGSNQNVSRCPQVKATMRPSSKEALESLGPQLKGPDFKRRPLRIASNNLPACSVAKSRNDTRTRRNGATRPKRKIPIKMHDKENVSSSKSKKIRKPVEDQDQKKKDDPASDDVYEVAKIMDYRMHEKSNRDEYYIRWKNYSRDYDTWEPESCLIGCNDALIIFYAKQAFRRRSVHVYKRQNNLPPIPRVISEILNGVAPITNEEMELAYKLSKSVSNVTRLSVSQLVHSMFDLVKPDGSDIVPKRPVTRKELSVLRQEVLMIESQRRKDHSLRELKEWEAKINAITERRPRIVVENEHDLAGPPPFFTYINDNVLGEGITFLDAPEGCDCKEYCINSKGIANPKCCPGKHGKSLAYDKYKRITIEPGHPIYECNKRCKCGPSCFNRVVQDEKTNLFGMDFCIFRTSTGKGWGVKTLKSIKKGTFVCAYVGEIITSEEAEKRGKVYESELGSSYLFDLDYKAADKDCPYTIDATTMGNVARFMNHSCEPNLQVFNVWVDWVDQNLPKLAFFALRDIKRGEELTYDYGSDDRPRKRKKSAAHRQCLCGTDACRRYIF